LQAALHEKEILLREIHHRVKNNLQVVSSLLTLQANRVKDPQAVTAFRESQSRIRSMALIHEKLYQSGDLAHIDFGDYVRHLAGDLLQAYNTKAAMVKVHLDVSEVLLGVDAAVPGGLILNELVSNALKHAFPGQRSGVIRLTLQRNSAQQIVLNVSDDGVGVPVGFEVSKSDTLGMTIVQALAKQVKGKLEVMRNEGTVFSLTFTDPAEVEKAIAA
jgi:two-component sensor histidine kinase